MLSRCCVKCFKDIHDYLQVGCRFLHYEQGQMPESGSREYFYYVDHQGQVNRRMIIHPSPHDRHDTTCILAQEKVVMCRACRDTRRDTHVTTSAHARQVHMFCINDWFIVLANALS